MMSVTPLWVLIMSSFVDVSIGLFKEVQELGRPVTLVAFPDAETRGEVG